jgi:hypothetical protein
MESSTSAQIETALIEIAVEGWRLSRNVSRALSRLDAGEASRYQNQLRYYLKRTEEALAIANLHIVDVEGHPYDAGMAATALNVADFPGTEALVVEQMIEPIIMGPGGLRRSGTVLLRRALP